jgi:hypothetical protein
MVAARSLRTVAVLWAVAGCLLVGGCGGSKVNKSNFDKISMGMSEADVEGVLGKGQEQAGAAINMPAINMPGMGNIGIQGMPTSAKTKTWTDGNRVITIVFLDGKVAGKTQAGL